MKVIISLTVSHAMCREKESIHHHRGKPPFFFSWSVVDTLLPDLWCFLFSLVFPGNILTIFLFCAMTSRSGDRPKEGCHGGGIYSFALRLDERHCVF